jgi:beta-galactosidase
LRSQLLQSAGAVSHGRGTRPPRLPSSSTWDQDARPDGSTITIDSESLVLDGRPLDAGHGGVPLHALSGAEWREELLKMKAGGITIVSTYVFWIHHEEVEGQWDWTGNHDLREFVRLAGEVGSEGGRQVRPLVPRRGPQRRLSRLAGGNKGWRLQERGPRFLGKVRLLYSQIAGQLDG